MKKILMTRLSVCSLGVSCNEMIDTPMLLVVTQHHDGFREGRSCLSALLGVYDDIMSSLSEGSECVDMVTWFTLNP